MDGQYCDNNLNYIEEINNATILSEQPVVLFFRHKFMMSNLLDICSQYVLSTP